jgi:hypothetical protein
MDLSGRWDQYAINKKRTVTWYDYWVGWRSFMADQILLFLPFMTFCFWFSHDKILNCHDNIYQSLLKLGTGYVIGKLWAFGAHYVLHFPMFYRFHKKHHPDPRKLCASASWLDSFVEYALMELPSFGICVLFLPTHLVAHLCHFVFHGIDGAYNHSGFSFPGTIGSFFDSEYHYLHHSLLTANYAELEFLDLLFGTHNTQKNKKLSNRDSTKNTYDDNGPLGNTGAVGVFLVLMLAFVCYNHFGVFDYIKLPRAEPIIGGVCDGIMSCNATMSKY